VGIVVADAAVQYRSEAFHGEVMVVGMSAGDFGSKGCDLLWRMHEKLSQREVARGKTGIVFFDYAARKVAPVPASFRARAASLNARRPRFPTAPASFLPTPIEAGASAAGTLYAGAYSRTSRFCK
jgi:hypothetical protein